MPSLVERVRNWGDQPVYTGRDTSYTPPSGGGARGAMDRFGDSFADEMSRTSRGDVIGIGLSPATGVASTLLRSIGKGIKGAWTGSSWYRSRGNSGMPAFMQEPGGYNVPEGSLGTGTPPADSNTTTAPYGNDSGYYGEGQGMGRAPTARPSGPSQNAVTNAVMTAQMASNRQQTKDQSNAIQQRMSRMER